MIEFQEISPEFFYFFLDKCEPEVRCPAVSRKRCQKFSLFYKEKKGVLIKHPAFL
jgi:hypothetical protein